MKGQVALIVLVISAVIMTVGLSMSKKAIVDTKIDIDEELLQQAFNAAESGVDYFLGTGATGYSLPDGSNVKVEVSFLGGGSSLDFGEFVSANGRALFWLVGHDVEGKVDYETHYGGNSVDINADDGFSGSVKVDYYYLEGGVYKVARSGFNYGGGNTVSGFEVGSGAMAVDTSSGIPLLLAVTPIFEGSNFSLTGNDDFPAQGKEIKATGRVTDELEGGVSQIVRVYERYNVPAFLLDAMTAGGSVLSN